MKNHITLFAVLILTLSLAGCGGGGGGGGASNAPVHHFVTIGSVQFDTATSTSMTPNAFGFDLTANQNWNIATPIGTAPSPETISYPGGLLALPGQDSLPYALVQYAAASPPGNPPNTPTSVGVAVGTDGALYVVTASAPSGTTTLSPVSQPILVLPNDANQTVGYTVATGLALTGASIDSYMAAIPAYQLTVISTAETSPHGYLNCLHVRLTNGAANPSYFNVIDVWYQAGEGAVDSTMTGTTGGGSPTTINDEEFRGGIAFPG